MTDRAHDDFERLLGGGSAKGPFTPRAHDGLRQDGLYLELTLIG
jgi:hypothetical protein